MSKLKNRLEKMASNEAYEQFNKDLMNLSDEFERILQDAKNNPEVYNTIMNNEQALSSYTELVKMNQSLATMLLAL